MQNSIIFHWFVAFFENTDDRPGKCPKDKGNKGRHQSKGEKKKTLNPTTLQVSFV